MTDGRAVRGELSDASVGGQPCQPSTSQGWHTDGGFGGGGGGCLGGGAGGGYTGMWFLQSRSNVPRADEFHSVMSAFLVICPIAVAYSMGQIIKSVCVCQSVCVFICEHSHGRIS